jgi:putative hydrolase of the HAD superfamily
MDIIRPQGLKAIIGFQHNVGDPAFLWRELLEGMGMDGHIAGTVFCRDIGWRKPHPRIYQHALGVAMTPADGCLFVGDNPVWDVEGPTAVGIRSVLLDRRKEWVGQPYGRVTSLVEVTERCLR